MTEVAALRAAVAALPTIQLVGLQGEASLLSRRERKYLVPISVAASLVEAVSSGALALQINGERSFTYQSIYFDTPGGQSILLLLADGVVRSRFVREPMWMLGTASLR